MARSFAPLRAGEEGADLKGSDRRQTDPLRFGDAAVIDPAVTWRRRASGDLLRVPIGAAADGGALMLDLKESAQGGMGPHGLVVGATGSGKSELLRTLVTALAVSHPPETLALLLADFKGGATFSGLARLPHVSGMITNLEADLSLVDRFRDALGGEVQRRQEVLAAAGKLTSLEPYLELRHRRPELEAMPHLLVIVDEFSELLGARPDLADLFVTIGRIGRSMGIHLLLATQRLDTGRIRGLESHLSYRICLRTFSESESREAIGSPDAYHLPAEPGWGYLRADSPEQRLFRGVTVTRPYRPPRLDPVSAGTPILPFSAHNGIAARIAALHESRLLAAGSGRFSAVSEGRPTGAGATREQRRRTVLDVAVERLTTLAPLVSQGRQARRVWLDPLPQRLTLADLLRHSRSFAAPKVLPHGVPAHAESGRLGDTRPVVASVDHHVGRFPTKHDRPGERPRMAAGEQPDRIAAVLGLVDIPERQRQQLLEWDFTDGNGNLLIVGAGRSGKSTAVRTLLVSLALQHSPGAVQVICVDFGGETLVPFGDLPHVAAVATRSNPELTRRVAARISALLTEREELFRRHRFESTTALRRARSAGDLDPTVAGDVVLIFDGWAGVSEADGFPDGVIDEILRRGASVGVHTVLTVASPSQLRTRLIAGFGGRIELRLSDSFDSAIDRQLARSLPIEIPGRALVAGRHFAQLALPLLEPEVDDAADSGQAPHRAAARTAADHPAARTEAERAAADPNQVGVHSIATRSTTSHRHARHSAEHVIAAVRARWPGESALRIRTLPEWIGLADLRAMAEGGAVPQGMLLGLGEDDLGPVRHNLWGENPHLVVYGDGRSGKTTLLRGLLAQLVKPASSSADAEVLGVPDIVIVDYRRGMAPATANSALGLAVATNPAQASTACRSLAAKLARRVNEPTDDPGSADPTADGRVGRRPEIYLLVDDYDLVGTVAGNPLHLLLPYLPHARDVGFHLVLTRRTGGAARAQYEALLQVLGDLGTPVLMLSGSPAEGRLAHGLVPQLLPAGRARLATRGTDPQLIQIPWVD